MSTKNPSLGNEYLHYHKDREAEKMIKKTKKIKVIAWVTGDGEELYRLDDKNDAVLFFEYLNDNAEVDGREEFRVYEMTQKEWKEAEALGESMA